MIYRDRCGPKWIFCCFNLHRKAYSNKLHLTWPGLFICLSAERWDCRSGGRSVLKHRLLFTASLSVLLIVVSVQLKTPAAVTRVAYFLGRRDMFAHFPAQNICNQATARPVPPQVCVVDAPLGFLHQHRYRTLVLTSHRQQAVLPPAPSTDK